MFYNKRNKISAAPKNLMWKTLPIKVNGRNASAQMLLQQDTFRTDSATLQRGLLTDSKSPLQTCFIICCLVKANAERRAVGLGEALVTLLICPSC